MDLSSILSELSESKSISNSIVGYFANRANTVTTDADCVPGLTKFQSRVKFHRLSESIENCGSWLHLRDWLQHDTVQVKQANFCQQHLVCRVCAVRRAAKYAQAYHEKITSWMEIDENKLLSPYMITLTITNRGEISDGITHLTNSFRKIWKKGRNERKGQGDPNCPSIMSRVIGGFYSYEVKRGQRSGLWHPHIHALAFLDVENHTDYTPAQISELRQRMSKQLSDEWSAITGDSYIVDCKPWTGEILHAVFEAAKYITKYKDTLPDDIWHVACACRKKRMVAPLGTVRGVKVPSILDDDLDGDYIDYVAKYINYQGRRGYTVKPMSKEQGDQFKIRRGSTLPEMLLHDPIAQAERVARYREWLIDLNIIKLVKITTSNDPRPTLECNKIWVPGQRVKDIFYFRPLDISKFSTSHPSLFGDYIDFMLFSEFLFMPSCNV